MSVIYNTTLKNARMDAVDAEVNGGGGAGKLEIGTASMATILATITLDATAFAAAVAGVLTLAGVPLSDTSADNTGTAVEARIRDNADADVVTGLTVGVGSEDIVLDSVNITAGQTVTINSGTLTHG